MRTIFYWTNFKLISHCNEVTSNCDRCERNEIICLSKGCQRKVAWGYPVGGVLCDQTSNGFSLIKKEIESGLLNEQHYPEPRLYSRSWYKQLCFHPKSRTCIHLFSICELIFYFLLRTSLIRHMLVSSGTY